LKKDSKLAFCYKRVNGKLVYSNLGLRQYKEDWRIWNSKYICKSFSRDQKCIL